MKTTARGAQTYIDFRGYHHVVQAGSADIICSTQQSRHRHNIPIGGYIGLGNIKALEMMSRIKIKYGLTRTVKGLVQNKIYVKKKKNYKNVSTLENRGDIVYNNYYLMYNLYL